MIDGGIVWISGAPASGKTTLAKLLYERLRSRGHPTLWLDSDELRAVMTPTATYDPQDRQAFYDTLGFLALRAHEGGVFALVSATAAKASYRQSVRARAERFFEILLRVPLEERQRRDPKGLYQRAAAGTLHNLPGFDMPFEENGAELVLDAEHRSAQELSHLAAAALERAWGVGLTR